MSDRGSSSGDPLDHPTCPAEQVKRRNKSHTEELDTQTTTGVTCMDVLSGRVREEEKSSAGGGRLNIYGRHLSLGQAGTRPASNHIASLCCLMLVFQASLQLIGSSRKRTLGKCHKP